MIHPRVLWLFSSAIARKRNTVLEGIGLVDEAFCDSLPMIPERVPEAAERTLGRESYIYECSVVCGYAYEV